MENKKVFERIALVGFIGNMILLTKTESNYFRIYCFSISLLCAIVYISCGEE